VEGFGFAGAKGDDVHAGFFESVGLGGGGQDDGFGDEVETMGEHRGVL
jgi:hypothetical protein